MKEAMLSRIGRYAFGAEPFHCDFSSRMLLSHAANCMLNAAEFHSDERGYGMTELRRMGRTWVLSRLVVEMNDMPPAYSRINIDTWVEGVMRFFTSRDFSVTGTEGQQYGYGRSIWAMIDSHTRQPVEIATVGEGIIARYVESDRPCPIKPFARIKLPPTAERAGTVTAQYSDVDVNGHVNSAKYIEHILDLWDIRWHEKHRITRLDIAYTAEAHSGDTLAFYVDDTVEGARCVSVRRSRDGSEEVEACLARLTFWTVGN